MCKRMIFLVDENEVLPNKKANLRIWYTVFLMLAAINVFPGTLAMADFLDRTSALGLPSLGTYGPSWADYDND